MNTSKSPMIDKIIKEIDEKKNRPKVIRKYFHNSKGELVFNTFYRGE